MPGSGTDNTDVHSPITWTAARGAFGRWRRELRRRLLEPILVGHRAFRETVLNALAARGHLIYCRLPEGNLFVDPSDRVVGSWLMWHGRWQREEIGQAIGVLREAGRLPADAVFVDAGANIGTHTLYAMHAGAFARAFAFEPEPNNARLLAMNVAANALGDRVTVVQAALGASEGHAVLHLHPRNKGAHAIGALPSPDATERVEVPVTRLATVLAAHRVAPDEIGLIWIDVEGSELAVLRGLGDCLGRVPLVLEYAPDRPDPDAARALRELLQRHYTTLHRVGPQTAQPEPIGALAGIAGIADILVY
jgi:FkbM family methyltransferase